MPFGIIYYLQVVILPLPVLLRSYAPDLQKEISRISQQSWIFYKFRRFLPCIDGNYFYQWILPDLWQIQSCSTQTFSIILFLTQQSHRMTFKWSTKMQSVRSTIFVLICSSSQAMFILQKLKMRIRYNNLFPPAGAFKKS